MKNINTKYIAASTTRRLLFATSIAVFSSMVQSQPTSMSITAQCTTKTTGADGVRHSCYSELVKLNAPEDLFFAPQLTEGGKGSAAGSTHQCRLKYSGYVDLFPGIGVLMPTVVTLQAHAVGPKGYWAGRGWVKCRYEVFLSKLPQS